MPTITLTPTACTSAAGWQTLYYCNTTNSSYFPRQLIFTFPANATLAGLGVQITRIVIHGHVRNSSSVAKNLRLGFKPAASSDVNTWSALDGASVLDGVFQAAGSSNGAAYKAYNFARSYSPTGNSDAFALFSGHIKASFEQNKPVYLGVIQPTDGRSIQVDPTLAQWTMDVSYELLGNIPSASVSAATLGATAITTTVTRIMPGSTTTLKYSIGSTVVKTVSLGTGVSDSYTPPTTLGSHFPAALTAVLTITAETSVGGAVCGSVSTSVTLTLPDGAAPACSAAPSIAWVSGVAAAGQIGAYVQRKSGVKFVLSGTGKYGASIKSYALAIEGKTYSGASVTHTPLAGSGNVPYTLTVIDSRGLEGSYAGSIAVVAWQEPKIAQFDIVRTDAAGSEAIDGTYARAILKASASSLTVGGAQKNTLKYRIDYREIAAEGAPENAWIATDTLTASGLSAAFDGLLRSGGAAVGGGGNKPFNDMLGYEFRAVVTDLYAASSALDSMPTKEMHWDIDEDTGKMGFGGDAPGASESVGYRFYRPIEASDKHGAELCGASLELSAPPTAAVSLATGAYVDTVIFTAPRSGLYAISYSCMFSSNATGWRFAALIVDGKSIATARGAAVASARYINLTGFARLAADQTVAVEHAQNSGATLTVTHAQLQAVRIGA